MSPIITFDESAAEVILEMVGRELQHDSNYSHSTVIDSKTGEIERAEDGTYINDSTFAGLEGESAIVLHDRFSSLVNHVKRRDALREPPQERARVGVEALEELIDIRIGQGPDIAEIIIENTSAEYISRKEDRTLTVNLGAVSPEDRHTVLDTAVDQLESTGWLLRTDIEEKTRVLETNFTEDEECLVELYDGRVSTQYRYVLESSLYLRGLMEQREFSFDEMERHQYELSMGAEQFYLSRLVVADYLDRDSGLYAASPQLRGDSECCQELLETLARLELVCLFISESQSVDEIIDRAKDSFMRHQRENPPQEWFDIRGIENKCTELLEGTIAALAAEFPDMEFDRVGNGLMEGVRIYQDSLPDLTRPWADTEYHPPYRLSTHERCGSPCSDIRDRIEDHPDFEFIGMWGPFIETTDGTRIVEGHYKVEAFLDDYLE